LKKRQIGVLSNGKPKIRDADVEVIAGMVQTGGGTSLYARDKFFKGNK
jgi:hypothetical protein